MKKMQCFNRHDFFFYIKELELAWSERIKLYLDNIGLGTILAGNKKDPEKLAYRRNTENIRLENPH